METQTEYAGIGLQPVQIDTDAIALALERDAEFFIQFFMGEELTHPIPDFHIDIFYSMISLQVDRYACAIPRDHAKTTLAKLACVWYFLFSRYRFIVYLSNTSSIAVNACVDIIAFIESDNFKQVFGLAQFDIRQEGTGFYKFTIIIKGEEKICILRAQGAGMQVRGLNIDNKRPQLAIVDDLEDTDNIATEELFMKLKRWFYGTFRKALDKFDHKIIHLGNMISNKCMLKEHCESPYWNSIRYGCIKSNLEPLWPEAWPIDKLRRDFQEYLAAGMIDIWFTEMMNLPQVVGNGLIRAHEITYRPQAQVGEIEYGFITIDPAISTKAWAHKTAIVVHVWVPDYNMWQIVDYIWETGIDPVTLFNTTVRLAAKWSILVVGIESVAYQASLQYMFKYLAGLAQLNTMIFLPLASGIVRKTQRIAAWASTLKEKPDMPAQYCLYSGDFQTTTQLLEYNPMRDDNEDDLIDSCAYGVQMIDRYMMQILHTRQIIINQPAKTVYEMARV